MAATKTDIQGLKKVFYIYNNINTNNDDHYDDYKVLAQRCLL